MFLNIEFIRKGDTLNEGLVVFVRGLIAFISLLIYARILGKQQIRHLIRLEKEYSLV